MGNSIRTTSSATPANQTTFKAGDSVLCPSLGLRDLTFTLIADSDSKSKLLAIKCHDRFFRFDIDGYLVSANECETAEYTPRLYRDTPANRAAIATLYGLNIVDSVERLSNDSVQNSVHSNVELCSNNREENHLEAKDYRTVEQRFSGISGFCPYTGELIDSTERLAEHTERTATFSKIDHSQNNREESEPSSTEHRTIKQHLFGFSESYSPNLKIINSIHSDDNEAVLLSSCTLSDTACDVFGAAEVMNDIGQLLYLIYNEKLSPRQAKSMARLIHVTTDSWNSILQRSLNTLNEPLEQTKYGKVED